MKKYAVLIIMIFLVPALMFSAKTITVKGSLLGFDGKALKMGHVHYGSDNRRSISESVDADGNFNFTMELKPTLNLSFSGVDHKASNVQIYTLPDDEVIQLDVKLSPNNINPDFSEVKVIGNFNDYNFEAGIPLLKQADGIYSLDIEKTGDTLLYQILGPFTTPELRSVNGKQASFFVYDGGGDYRSAIVSKDKRVRIAFNPSDFRTDNPSAVITSKDPQIAEYLIAQNTLADAKQNLLATARKLYTDKKPIELKDAFAVANGVGSLGKIKSMLINTENKRLQKFIYFYYLNIANMSIDFLGNSNSVDKEILMNMINSIPPDDESWQQNYSGLPTIFDVLGSGKTEKYVESASSLLPEYPKNSVNNQVAAIKLVQNYKTAGFIKSIIKDTSEKYSGALYEAVKLASEKKMKDAKMIFYDLLLKDYPKTWYASAAKKEYSDNKAVEVGKQVPKFSLKSLDDSNVVYSPAYFKGRYVLIDIWATWCGPCLGELPNLHNVYEKYKDKNFTIFSISFDDKPETVTKFRGKKWKMPWDNAFIEGQFGSEIGEAFEVMGIPRPVLIDPNGKIIAMEVELRGANLEKTLEKYIK